jgi:hypothetical protein
MFSWSVFFGVQVATCSGMKKSDTNISNKLKGFMLTCIRCKNILDDRGYWVKAESCLSDFGKVEFAYCICSKCAQKLFQADYKKEN